jgi:predicted nucleotidyltransferase
MKNLIEQVFRDNDEIPLFYIEGGSRLWGIASPDSDFDVRGFHLQSKEQCYDFKNHRDIIEILDGDFDFVSYDIDKMFKLLSKSNPSVFEWIRSNIIYFNKLPNWIEFQEQIIENFDFKSLFHHYKSLAKAQFKLMESKRLFTYKRTFYCIRGLLSSDLASRQIIPELLIDNLFKQFDNDNEIIKKKKNSLEKKKQQIENEKIPKENQQEILLAIKDFTRKLELKKPESSGNRGKLENILTDYAFFIKTKYYI